MRALCNLMTILFPLFQNPLVKNLRTNILVRYSDKKLEPLPYDTVELSPLSKLQGQAKSIFSKTRKFSIDDYNSLSRLEKAIVRETTRDTRSVA